MANVFNKSDYITLPQLKKSLEQIVWRLIAVASKTPEIEDDINVLNMLAECGLATPITDSDGAVLVDANGNYIVG